MAHDGSAGVSPDGWLPDRVSIGALTKSFPPELVDRATEAHEERRRLLPARLVMYFVLALWLFRGPNCGYGRVMTKLVDGLYHRRRAEVFLATGRLDRQVEAGVDRGRARTWQQPNISSLSRARVKLGPDPVRHLFEQVAGPVAAPEAEGVWVCGLRVVSMDGSTSDVPDTEDNRAAFSGPSNDKRDGAFPQVRWVVAAESGTGALVEATIGAYTTGEQTLARDLLGAFTDQMLVLADRNFLSHALARDTLATGAHILWRASASFRLRPTKVLPDGTYLAQLRPARKADGPPITVRVIEYTVHTTGIDPVTGEPDPDAGPDAEERSEVFALVTDLLDPDTYPALDLARAYPLRWECETVIKHHKSMGPGQPVLRSKDPEGVAQEMWSLFAVYQALAQLIDTGVDATGLPPGRISFPAALAAATDTVGAFSPR